MLTRPGGDIERVHGRAVNTLLRLGLIERTGGESVRVAHSGHSWIAANLDKHPLQTVTFERSNGGRRRNRRTRDAVTRDAAATPQCVQGVR